MILWQKAEILEIVILNASKGAGIFRRHQSIVIGTQNGCIATLAVPAEVLDEEEEDEEGGAEKVKKQIDTPLNFLCRYHTGPIVAIH